MSKPTTEDLAGTIEQASRGDWIQEAYLKGLAADLIDKGESLPLPLRAYIATPLRESAEPVNADVHAFSLQARDIATCCFMYLNRRPDMNGADVAREKVAEFAARTVHGIRQLPAKFGRGRRLPESLRKLESIMVWVLFMLGYRENGIDPQALLSSWQDAVAAVSERLDPGREACGEKGPRRRSGFGDRSIANILARFDKLSSR